MIILITFLISLHANSKVVSFESYINEVMEAVHAEEVSISEIAKGKTHLTFSEVRREVSRVTSRNANVKIIQTWKRRGEAYVYVVMLDRTSVAVIYSEGEIAVVRTEFVEVTRFRRR